ncbi:M48 family metallopeptidase [Geothrix campi]|jgi:predicted Zn-dependent protease|uniref:M48 family metallopeptidase n=1 Tax=Geothrix campi TaxID=2966450 RepID=UPI0021472D62|nr:M48 family metallopeptidase [Geothrix sp. SG10]
MERRHFIETCGCCSAAALLGPALRAAQGWVVPPRLARPAPKTDEGGLWALMDREEERLRQSPFLMRDAALTGYVHAITCRLAQAHCPDIRTYVVRSPYFNANMAPNGMMQVWTGLILRAENEAQLAAVIGHEVGHYLARHSLERLRDAKSRSAFASVLGLVPIAGPLAGLGVLAGGFAYSRTHERAADQIGLELMAAAGYPPLEAAKVWTHLLEELQAEKDWTGDASTRSVLFATHPTEKEREAKLEAAARALGKADLDPQAQALRRAMTSWRRAWLEDELKRRKFGESLALLGRLTAADPQDGEAAYFLGETYRLRASQGDAERALAAYQKAAALPSAPPEVHRALGVLHRKAGRLPEMREAYGRYLAARPEAEDAEMIRSYLKEGG